MNIPRGTREDKTLRPGQGDDPATYVVNPDSIEKPWIYVPPNGPFFVFPGGVEGFDLTGAAAVSNHKALGGNVPRAIVVHRDEFHVVLSGAFVGDRAFDNGRALRQVCVANTPDEGKLLYVPYVLDNYQQVIVESHSIRGQAGNDFVEYSVSCLKIGTGATAHVEHHAIISRPFPILSTPRQPRGKGAQPFVVNSKFNTLRKIARLKFGTTGRWGELYSKNHKYFEKHNVTFHKAADHRLPLGTKIAYK